MGITSSVRPVLVDLAPNAAPEGGHCNAEDRRKGDCGYTEQDPRVGRTFRVGCVTMIETARTSQPADRQIRVFISSTFRDMQAEREDCRNWGNQTSLGSQALILQARGQNLVR
jgi:hypothetical protein